MKMKGFHVKNSGEHQPVELPIARRNQKPLELAPPSCPFPLGSGFILSMVLSKPQGWDWQPGQPLKLRRLRSINAMDTNFS